MPVPHHGASAVGSAHHLGICSELGGDAARSIVFPPKSARAEHRCVSFENWGTVGRTGPTLPQTWGPVAVGGDRSWLNGTALGCHHTDSGGIMWTQRLALCPKWPVLRRDIAPPPPTCVGSAQLH